VYFAKNVAGICLFLILGSVFSDCVVFYGDILCYKSLLRHALHCVLSVLQRYRFIQFSSGDYRTITDRVSGEDNAIGHVRLFACLTLSFEQFQQSAVKLLIMNEPPRVATNLIFLRMSTIPTTLMLILQCYNILNRFH